MFGEIRERQKGEEVIRQRRMEEHEDRELKRQGEKEKNTFEGMYEFDLKHRREEEERERDEEEGRQRRMKEHTERELQRQQEKENNPFEEMCTFSERRIREEDEEDSVWLESKFELVTPFRVQLEGAVKEQQLERETETRKRQATEHRERELAKLRQQQEREEVGWPVENCRVSRGEPKKAGNRRRRQQATAKRGRFRMDISMDGRTRRKITC